MGNGLRVARNFDLDAPIAPAPALAVCICICICARAWAEEDPDAVAGGDAGMAAGAGAGAGGGERRPVVLAVVFRRPGRVACGLEGRVLADVDARGCGGWSTGVSVRTGESTSTVELGGVIRLDGGLLPHIPSVICVYQ